MLPEEEFEKDVLDGLDIIDRVYLPIEGQLKKRNLGTLRSSTDLLNHINQVAKSVGIDDFNMKYPDEYRAVVDRIKEFLKKQKTSMTENKKVIKEAPTQSIPTPRSILNYKDDDVIAGIKKEVGKNKDFTILKIYSNAEQFYNVIISWMIPDEEWSFELDKYKYLQQIHKYRVELFTELSKILPVVNVNLAAFDFVKGNEEIKFAFTVLLSNTNNKDWVTGRVKKTDAKERLKLLQTESKKTKINEIHYEQTEDEGSIEEDMSLGFEFQPANVPGTPTSDEEFLECDGMTKSIPVKESELMEGNLYQLSESNGLIKETVQLIQKNNGKYLFEKSSTGAKIRINAKDISTHIFSIKRKVIKEGWKQAVAIKVPDAMDMLDKARGLRGVVAVNAITKDEIKIQYDSRKTNPDTLKLQLES